MHDAEWFRKARVRRVERDGRTMIRLRGYSPPMAILATFAVAVVIGGFAYPIAAMFFNPKPVPVVLIVGAGVVTVVLALHIAWHRHKRIQTGCEDLIIDDTRRTLSLPRTFGRECETVLRFDQVTDIVPAEVVSKLGRNDIMDAEAFGPNKYLKKDASPDDEIRDVGPRRARSLTFWLRHRLGVGNRLGR